MAGLTGDRPATPRVRLPWRRALGPLLLLLAAACLGMAIERAWVLAEAVRDNHDMARGEAGAGASAMLLLARAVRLEAEGRHDEALTQYAQAEALGSPAVRHAVTVNVSNLYLQRGIAAAAEDGQVQRALVLVQLAKAGYRRALREQADDWNARYNLELANRVVPDYEVRNWRRSGSEAEVEEALKRDKAGWSDMVGQPRGMH